MRSCRFLAILIASLFVAFAAQGQKLCAPQAPPLTLGSTLRTIAWTDCVTGRQQTFSFPSAVRLLPRRIRVFKDGYTGPYLQEVEVVDTIWVDDVIEINEPLRSYGGDIILYANTIRINAPIDSKFYIYQNVDHFSPGSDKHANGFKKGESFNTPSWTRTDDMDRLFIPAWTQYYEKCFDCLSDGRGPQLPDGLAGNYVVREDRGFPIPLEGNLPPDDFVRFDQVRAGNIYIFAKEVTVSDSLSHPFLPEDRAECKGKSTEVFSVRDLSGRSERRTWGSGSSFTLRGQDPG